jgi:hypothetical protein
MVTSLESGERTHIVEVGSGTVSVLVAEVSVSDGEGSSVGVGASFVVEIGSVAKVEVGSGGAVVSGALDSPSVTVVISEEAGASVALTDAQGKKER